MRSHARHAICMPDMLKFWTPMRMEPIVGDMPCLSRRPTRLALGESVFFADNGIAAGQGPTDTLKELSDPRPSRGDISSRDAGECGAAARSDVAIDSYYQFEWRKNATGSGTYFSEEDVLDAGGERYLLSNGTYWLGWMIASPAADQFGAALRFTSDFNYGFYALRSTPRSGNISAADAVVRVRKCRTISARLSADRTLWRKSQYLCRDSNVGVRFRFGGTCAVSFPCLCHRGSGGRERSRTLCCRIRACAVSSVSDRRAWIMDGATDSGAVRPMSLNSQRTRGIDPAKQASLSFEAYFEPEYFEVLPNLDVRIPTGRLRPAVLCNKRRSIASAGISSWYRGNLPHAWEMA